MFYATYQLFCYDSDKRAILLAESKSKDELQLIDCHLNRVKCDIAVKHSLKREDFTKARDYTLNPKIKLADRNTRMQVMLMHETNYLGRHHEEAMSAPSCLTGLFDKCSRSLWSDTQVTLYLRVSDFMTILDDAKMPIFDHDVRAGALLPHVSGVIIWRGVVCDVEYVAVALNG
jgi:hypothetical protein